MDGTPNDASPGSADAPDVAEMIEELEAADPTEAPPLAEQIAETLEEELEASTEEPETGDGGER